MTDLQAAGRDHLWLHFSRHSTYERGGEMPMIVRGEGHRIWDSHGREYIDGLAGLFVVQVGHGREELAEAAARQARELAFFPLWSFAHPRAVELADRLAAMAPGDLNRVFFTTGGGEAVDVLAPVGVPDAVALPAHDHRHLAAALVGGVAREVHPQVVSAGGLQVCHRVPQL